MSRTRKVATTAALLAGVLALSACSTNREEASSGGGGSCDTSKGTLVVGFVAPLSGSLSALGLGMKNSTDLAVNQANQACKVPGYRLALQAEDDQATAQIAGQAATKLASDPNVVGVIGTLNSSTAQTVAPILAQKKIVEISPANTNPALTQGDNYATAPARPNATYFRTATTDAIQGPFAAQFLVQKQGKKNIAVIDDGKTYGAGLADQFAAEAQKLGATIAARLKVGEKDTDFSGVITQIRGANPDAVYYGGEYPVAGPLSKQLADAGLNIPLMGGDGIVDSTYAQLGGREGDFATNVGAPPEQQPSAKAFIDAYAAAGYSEPYSAYGALTYDAANVLIDGLSKTVGNGTFSDASRDGLISAVQATNLQGATGAISFDQFGDTTNKVLTVYTVQGGKFTPLETGTYAAS
ncbi:MULTISPECIES: branched-chain amino acid ABC transporter substrate-binding protein [Pseudonocardia]|uniref:Branched-chain amino acid transport system substrate-binding protein n=1 Tax=Pseudonocardia oroxyli TaxID=366584 RepID=A0A1G7IRR5_PSEOR|nr:MULTISPECIES: branched-chain amino acid ABC transporter substrate-binding protein [Pseudonocardia]MCF7549311.1 branched-chain amino acid ABC transporter substrate-binding protein [Pseudonocardia sp. WMMC193]SDF15353.1 branched-chain amino acid transport system substrate-binding protein [Pseudonocardia oroxyli]